MTWTECSHRWRRTGTELHPTETLRLWACPWCGTTRTTAHPYLDQATKRKQVAGLLLLKPPQDTPYECPNCGFDLRFTPGEVCPSCKEPKP